MNPFISPIFLFRVLQSYLLDINRLERQDARQIRRYKEKKLHKIVKYASTVPLYQKKFKKANISADEIHTLDDITKLPFITKKEFKEHYPNNIISSSSNNLKTIQSYTSGTTGEPVSIFIDSFTIVKGLFGYIRTLREHRVDWRKTKMTVIVDLSENSVEREYLTEGIIPNLKPFFSLDNMQFFNTYDNPRNLIKEIDDFKPEFIGGYPGMLRQLTYLKRKGFGIHIQPRCMISSGSVLDKYLKQYIENTFDTKLFDAYGAMESGPAIFQCKKGNYHIHSDLVHLEFVDETGRPVAPGEPGHVVVTKLYGRGTPIIRYTGLDDIITPSNETCSCGLEGGIISKIHGRKKHSIVLPNGNIVLSSTLDECIGELYSTHDIEFIERFQIVQHSLTNIELLVVVDEESQQNLYTIKRAFETIKTFFEEKFGNEMTITIRKVRDVKPHTPSVLSKIDINGITNKKYI
jgi:phenylacetate-CoA ligase